MSRRDRPVHVEEIDLKVEPDPELIDARAHLRGRPRRVAAGWRAAHPCARWLAPTSMRAFLARHHGRAPLHVDGAAGRFEPYFSVARLGELLATGAVPPAHLDAMRNGRRVDATSLGAERADGRFGRNLVLHVVRDRGSIVISSLCAIEAGADRLRRELCEWTGLEARVNAYYTPAGSRTFPWHWDNHDVFILQISGRKRWQIYEQAVSHPLQQHQYVHWPDRAPPASVRLDAFELDAGDLMYIPAGFPHEATTGATESLHLTVALHGVALHDVLSDLVADTLLRAEADVAYRSPYDPDRDGARTRTLSRRLFAKLDFERARAMAARRRHGHVSVEALTGLWRARATVGSLGPDDLVAHTGEPFWPVRGERHALVRMRDRVLRLDPALWPAVEFIGAHAELRARDLPRTGFCPVDLVRGLVLHGVLYPRRAGEAQ